MPVVDYMPWARARVSAALERGADDRLVAIMVASRNLIVSIGGRTVRLSSEADRALLRAWREAADALLVGPRTLEAELYSSSIVEADGRTARLARGAQELPSIVTIDRSGRFDLDLALRGESHPPLTIYVPTGRARSDSRASWVELEDLSPARVLEDMRARLSVRLALCEGGPRLLWAALEEGLVTDLSLTIAPIDLSDGPSLFQAGREPKLSELLPTDSIEGYRFTHSRVDHQSF